MAGAVNASAAAPAMKAQRIPEGNGRANTQCFNCMTILLGFTLRPRRSLRDPLAIGVIGPRMRSILETVSSRTKRARGAAGYTLI
jgi:hypothetical protein